MDQSLTGASSIPMMRRYRNSRAIFQNLSLMLLNTTYENILKYALFIAPIENGWGIMNRLSLPLSQWHFLPTPGCLPHCISCASLEERSTPGP